MENEVNLIKHKNLEYGFDQNKALGSNTLGHFVEKSRLKEQHPFMRSLPDNFLEQLLQGNLREVYHAAIKMPAVDRQSFSRYLEDVLPDSVAEGKTLPKKTVRFLDLLKGIPKKK